MSKRVLILGGGFGGIYAALRLEKLLQPLLTFVVAGGGFAGVETLGAINDFIREALPFYPNLRREFVRTVLVTPEQVILPELSSKLGAYAQRKLAARG